MDSFSLDDVDYIKLDCEGFEFPAFCGAVGTITRNQPVISLEQKMGQPGRFDEKRSQYDCLQYLKQAHQYQVVGRTIDDWALAPPTKSAKFGQSA